MQPALFDDRHHLHLAIKVKDQLDAIRDITNNGQPAPDRQVVGVVNIECISREEAHDVYLQEGLNDTMHSQRTSG